MEYCRPYQNLKRSKWRAGAVVQGCKESAVVFFLGTKQDLIIGQRLLLQHMACTWLKTGQEATLRLLPGEYLALWVATCSDMTRYCKTCHLDYRSHRVCMSCRSISKGLGWEKAGYMLDLRRFLCVRASTEDLTDKRDIHYGISIVNSAVTETFSSDPMVRFRHPRSKRTIMGGGVWWS